MTECANDEMRDLLPAYAQDALGAAEMARVRAHVATCAACAQELEVLQTAERLFARATPVMDVAKLAKLMPTATKGAPVLTVLTSTRRFTMPRYALAAAASLLIVATLAIPKFFGPDANEPDVVAAADQNVPVALLGASALDDLGTDELEALLADLETMEATVSSEPIDQSAVRTSQTPEGT